MTSAPPEVLDLVERFAHNIDRYHRADYNETQARREFIDPFFAALGWDVDNRRGVAPQYQEVIHEATLRARGSVTAPDYCFRVGPERKFFVEAKKPAVDIRDGIHPAYQLRRYAWSAKLPLSILTDFEEFSVYDCRVKPNAADKAATARTLYFHYADYARRWDEIAAIFSREAVWRGDYDRYAETARGKRGTQEVDAVFLQQMEAWRALLAQNIALRNPQIASVRDLNFAVQKTIDRIIFLRICEDRDIEPYEQLKDIAGNSGVYAGLIELFNRADRRYNSGLFHFTGEKGRAEAPDTLTPGLAVDDRALREIIGSLYYPESPYEFSVLGADILGNVYEQFLGSVIRLTPAHRAVVEQKPEVRKAGGVYYTPRYIVEYIVKNTVGKLCEGKTPAEIAKLRILDPACGSGSFLLGAYQHLLDVHRDWYAAHPTRQARREIYEGAGGQWFLTTEEKKRILLNNIYGVDIDPQAVEVTKLSLLLKVLEGETAASLATQLQLMPERALPDLAANIKCGNSLIGPDFYDGKQMSLLDDEEAQRINAFDWRAEFPAIFAPSPSQGEGRGRHSPSPSEGEGRGEGGGFDAVIGNPPWGATFSGMEETYLREVYSVARARSIDSYALFIESGLRRLRCGGLLGYITPDTFLRKDDRLPVRKHLLENTCVQELIETGPMFSKVRDTWCLVSTLANVAPDEDSRIRQKQISRFIVSAEERLRKFGQGEWDNEAATAQSTWSRAPNMIIGYLIAETQQAVIRKMEDQPRLADLKDRYEISRGEEGSKFALKEKPEGDFCMVIPQDVERYLVGEGLRISSKSLTTSKVASYYRHPKLWIIRIQKMRWKQRLVCAPDERTQSAGMKTLQVIVSPMDSWQDLMYLQGLLASALMNFWCVNYLADDMNQSYLEKIPIRTINFTDPADAARHDRMVALVERILDLHKRLPAAQTPNDKTLLQRQIAATDREIDRLVYDLYALTDDEIAIVEGTSS